MLNNPWQTVQNFYLTVTIVLPVFLLVRHISHFKLYCYTFYVCCQGKQKMAVTKTTSPERGLNQMDLYNPKMSRYCLKVTQKNTLLIHWIISRRRYSKLDMQDYFITTNHNKNSCRYPLGLILSSNLLRGTDSHPFIDSFISMGKSSEGKILTYGHKLWKEIRDSTKCSSLTLIYQDS